MDNTITCPGPVRLPELAVRVTDADEEVFLLYTRLGSLKPVDSEDHGHFRGLGYVDSKEDRLTVRVELAPAQAHSGSPDAVAPRTKPGGRSRKLYKRKAREDEPVVHEFEVLQDKTALRSRTGDTGSVLWRASIDFLRLILQQHHFPTPDGPFDLDRLAQSHVIELGAGTGLLSVAIRPLVRRYTATDILALVPLIRKNIAHADTNSPASAVALDWTLPADRQLPDDVLSDPPDLVLAVDCIYHPSLVPPLLNTLAALAIPRQTVVLVISELRAEDVVREFLEGWLSRSDEGWQIWSVGGEAEDSLMGVRYAVWLGWRESFGGLRAPMPEPRAPHSPRRHATDFAAEWRLKMSRTPKSAYGTSCEPTFSSQKQLRLVRIEMKTEQSKRGIRSGNRNAKEKYSPQLLGEQTAPARRDVVWPCIRRCDYDLSGTAGHVLGGNLMVRVGMKRRTVLGRPHALDNCFNTRLLRRQLLRQPRHLCARSLLSLTLAMAQIAVDILQLVSETADVFPPLKSAAGGALYIAKMVQKFKSNKKEWAQFAKDINDRLACVVKLLPENTRTDTRNDLLAHVAHLEITLNKIKSSIKAIQDQKALKRIGSFARDPDKIKEMRRLFDDAIARFHACFALALTTGMDVAKILGTEPVQLVVERALDKFRAAIVVNDVAPVVMENDMRSAVRDAFPLVKGASWDPDRACLSGTHVAGSGKTAVANTVCQLVHEATDMHLLSSFFFARGIEGRDDYSKVLNHIIRDLAGLDRAIAREIGSIVEQNPSVATAGPSRQFAEIIMPLCVLYPADKPLVVVLDALDEACKEMDHPNSGFIGILCNKISNLPGNFRVIVTCRPEYKILHSLEEKEHIQKYHSPLSGSTAWDDIQLYMNEQLKSVDKLRDLPDDSPDLQLFLEKVEGLFIWVATVITFLRGCVDPYKQLKRVLEKNSPGNLPAEGKMESLYQTIFAECNWDDEDFQTGYSLFMGTIINLRTPLPVSAIEALHNCNDKGSMQRILRPVSSLLYGLDSDRDDKPVHILHLSLREFLTSTKHVSEPYFIHEAEHNQQLALCCVNTLNKELPNVTGLGYSTSYREEFDHAIIHLPQLGGVTQQLDYACQFWASHLEYVNVQSMDRSLVDALVHFIPSKIVPWLECMTVIHRFYPIYSWAQIYFPTDHDLLIQLKRDNIALQVTEEAVQLCRVLAAEKPHVFTKDLAWSLHSLSVDLDKFGRDTEALEAIEEAVQVWQVLAADKPEIFNKDLAFSLHSLSVILNNFGRDIEALHVIEKAVQLRRLLAADKPELFNKDLADSLHNLSIDLNDFGHRPEVFNTDLASSLHSLSVKLNNFGRYAEALQAIEDAIKLRRVLAADRPEVFNEKLADSLFNLSVYLTKFDRHTEAFQAMEEVVELQRVLAENRPEVYNKDLADSLHHISVDLNNFGHHTEALAAIEEAVDLWRMLVAHRPQVFKKDLAWSLLDLSMNLNNLGRNAEALKVIQEAIELWQVLAADRPEYFNKNLAISLHRLSIYLSTSGYHLEALQAIEKAIEVWKNLVEQNSTEYQSYLQDATDWLKGCQTKLDHCGK
ncbi:hypothetical protein BV25DRAFT_1839546 [Artomyces pyxidatus]|uniref:Uncharacterized protein n=1 Tax=Artomyces pyxidatus TaxID=48021 RepID=A0ACB8SX40_9AGAM|nr:hypothetical protein BV25DRAFT_1839546 [Artomyces pyxidatus]